MTDKGTGSGFAIGLVLGAVIGLAIGFLCAPRPGKETRGPLKEKASNVVSKVRETAAEAREKAKAKLVENLANH